VDVSSDELKRILEITLEQQIVPLDTSRRDFLKASVVPPAVLAMPKGYTTKGLLAAQDAKYIAWNSYTPVGLMPDMVVDFSIEEPCDIYAMVIWDRVISEGQMIEQMPNNVFLTSLVDPVPEHAGPIVLAQFYSSILPEAGYIYAVNGDKQMCKISKPTFRGSTLFVDQRTGDAVPCYLDEKGNPIR